jgi:hypothetical protein
MESMELGTKTPKGNAYTTSIYLTEHSNDQEMRKS